MAPIKSHLIKILDQELTVHCPEGMEGQLEDAALLLNNKMAEIRNEGKIKGFQTIAIMAALNLAHELSFTHKKNEENIEYISDKMKRLQDKIACVLIEE